MPFLYKKLFIYKVFEQMLTDFRGQQCMDMYQVELTTDMDVVSIVVNASDENEAISIALTMFEQGEVDTAGSMLINVAAFRAC